MPDSGTSPSVLVIEDDKASQQLLRELLEQEGYAVRVAPGGNRQTLSYVCCILHGIT